jgi:intracellular multiplication protein IcmP
VACQALAIAGRHAYATTALMSILNIARCEAGVLAPAQFAWLKLVDRPLWYALHSLGYEPEGTGRYLHPNPRVEAAGARDHWAAERASAVRSRSPAWDRSVEVLWRVAGPHPGGSALSHGNS